MVFSRLPCLLELCDILPYTMELHVIFLIVPLFAAIIIMQLALSDAGILHSILSQGWLVYIGKISYGLYLWHLRFSS